MKKSTLQGVNWLLWVMLLGMLPAWAQNGALKGVVTDGKGNPLANVTIQVAQKSTQSGEDGAYQISGLAEGSATVKASRMGYAPYSGTVTIQGITSLDISLQAETNQLDEVVVTGVLTKRTKLQSSVSVSSINTAQIEQAAPRSTAEIFRSIAGIKSEPTGGEGNSNITVRGIPIASGGAKFLQLQEDGMPVMQFGDVAFGNADIFVRNDQTLQRIEAIRGGSASTLASNSPAGIINFISKDGRKEGGSVMQSVGMDYSNTRTDFEYGSPITESLRFHIGGFYRQGEGPRHAGYTANMGGQLKANMTKEFKNGYVRVYFKYLNDKSIGYLPMPVQVSGTNANPTWSSLGNFDILHDTPHSAYMLDNLTIGADGERRRSNMGDGMHPIVSSFGAELSFDLGEGWKLENRFRQNNIKGRFESLFPAEISTGGQLATAFGVSGLTYANGPQAGQAFDSNALAMRIHTFDTEINNFNNATNDVKLTKKIDRFDFTVGYYRALQNIGMSWLWNSYLMEVKGDNAALLNAGSSTVNGLYAYGVPAWGNCCTRNYDVYYDMSAPYAAVQVKANDKITLDASVRFDSGMARGTYAGAVQSANLDVNNDGVIQGPEQSVSVVDNANRKPVNYDYHYTSYSLGGNYLIDNTQSLFARYSRGGRANADRLLFGPNILSSGAAVSGLSADFVDQAEFGYKHRKGNYSFFATAFYSMVSEQNWDFGGGSAGIRQILRKYNAYGLELEGAARFNKFSITANTTLTKAKISADELNPTLVGNRPRRQAECIYNVVPQYQFGAKSQHMVGFSLIGTTKAFAQDSNQLVLPGYFYVNPFVSMQLTQGLTASLNVNNLFDTIGITEVEEGSITENQNNYLRARSINGRTTSLTLAYRF